METGQSGKAGLRATALGHAAPWDEPGIGIDVDWDWVEKHTVGVEE